MDVAGGILNHQCLVSEKRSGLTGWEKHNNYLYWKVLLKFWLKRAHILRFKVYAPGVS